MRFLTPDAGSSRVTVEEFAARVDPLIAAGSEPVGVAVSGGPDSVALFHLAELWGHRRSRTLRVYTVNHGLRPEAAAEIAQVRTLCEAAGLAHRTLDWRGVKPQAGLQAAARDARYRLLTAACRDDGVADLLLAHHLDDQAETLLHRIDRDTGPDGLAGMARVRSLDGVRLVRPLLDFPKTRLLATCRAAGLSWAEDSSNRDPRFARTELRNLASLLADDGITPARLGRLASAMATTRSALDGWAADWMAEHAAISPVGSVALNREALAGAHPVLRHRLVDRALRAIGGVGYPLRRDGVTRLLAWMAVDAAGTRVRTLAGCRVEADNAVVSVMRDWRQAGSPLVVAARGRGHWDGRFEIENPTAAPVRVGVCGDEGWRRWRRTEQSRRISAGVTVPYAARLALPAVVDLDGGIGLPHLVRSAPAPSGWVGERVRIRFRPSVPFLTHHWRPGDGVDYRPSLPCNGRQAT